MIIRLKLTKVGVQKLHDKGQELLDSLSQHPHFPEVGPQLEDLRTAIGRMMDARIAAFTFDKTRSRELKEAKKEVHQKIFRLAEYVETLTRGDRHMIRSAGFDVIPAMRNEPLTEPIPVPQNIKVHDTLELKTIPLRWKAVPGATGYVIQIQDPEAQKKGRSWRNAEWCRIASCRLKVAESKKPYSFRIAAIIKNEQSPWSEPVKGSAR